ncbi:TonB-dependent receptor [Phocaeicola vulgatus]|uniref:SusC/RagA family TonB-linked outer membrane protein n=1 Tax=Phocaeicola vulgatus TaxID=821 RepID=UPI0018A98EF4|nr:TonB-dependent receptor [Phocaeicola vulgatus]MDB0989307.1 TonB-dependent receptor [Phocaeicola vulgatus]MDB1011205.1 TonB-dependent receptor [Phocaeicola vulgatus]MDB1015924.1 TonB-dependent receptor [Phocaeicola vulgatus]MDB1024310.1 TonB-dependent receptor [Phocaeicola vulgatus]MDC1622625.1 TonB-dependent receptor [Phocaeicola vulgatus]
MKHLFLLLTLLSFSLTALAQQKVTGKVKDSSGEPVIGASVVVKGNNTMGTITDFDGNFMLDVPAKSVLVISYIGYVTQEIPTAGKNSLEIVLKEDTKTLDEVVVIGYGTQRKGDVTSSVASVKADNFVKGAVKDVGQLIQGKVAGLAITNPNGDPTGSTQIRLRGTNTIGGANTAPLVLIDGIPGELGTVAPEDVESVDVLKDGSAAAIYGTRGTNGVILITTKQAKGVDINQVEYNGYVSTSLIAKKLDMLNADEFRTLYPDQDHGADTDWIDEISRTPVSHVHNLSLMGGNSKTNYIANLNYTSRQGIMKKSDFESFQGRIEVTHRMFDDKLKLKFGLFGKKNQMESTTSGGSFRGWVYGQATRRNPTDPVRNEDGTWNENVSKFEYENPLALLYEAEGNVKKTQLRYNGNIVYNPIKDLTLSAVFSYIRDNMNRGYGETLNHISALRDGLAGWSSVGAYTKMEKLMELTAQYNKEIGAHKFSVLGGYSYNETDFEELWIDNYGFQDDYFGGWHNIGIGSALKDGKANIGSKKTPTNLIGFFGRATYSFKNRYLLMGALRYEGASQLWGTDNAWGLFPSISVGWRITEEAFMKNQKIFDDLKLRVGYGVTGSQPKDPFLGVAMLKYGSYAFVNGNWVQTIVPASNPNPDLKWEEKKETNIGLDFVSWGGRLSGSIDYYNRDVDGLIYEYGVPTPPNLYNKTMANGGTMRNRGVEVLVTVVPVQNKDFEWSTTGTFSLNSNKLISLSGSIFKSDYDYFNTGTVEYSGQVADSHRVQVGESIGNFYGFKVVDVDSEGRWIYEDRNGELVNYKDFTHAPEDKHVIGNGLPKWYAGWNNTLRYKNFDLNVTMRGAFGFQIINGGRMNYENVKNSRFENRLKSVNDLVFGKHTLSPEVEPEFNSYYVEDGDYWKIDNITLGYSFGQVGKYIKSLRIYGSVLNALTITGYKGIDPEVSTDGLTPGYDTRDRYPSVRSFTFGVNVKF